MRTAFKDVANIKFEGPKSKNPLAFRHYNASEIIEGRTMRVGTFRIAASRPGMP